jgi:hypothetical protein
MIGALQDTTGATVRIDQDSQLVRVDGVVLFKRLFRDGQIFLQCKDSDRLRSRNRGTAFIEVPLLAFVEVLTKTPYEIVS